MIFAHVLSVQVRMSKADDGPAVLGFFALNYITIWFGSVGL